MIIHDNLRREVLFHEGQTVNMHWYELYEALGLDPTRHLPAEGLPSQMVGNVEVWVVPKIPGVNQDAKRTWCKCPHCKKTLTAGKLFQHMRVHRKEVLNDE